MLKDGNINVSEKIKKTEYQTINQNLISDKIVDGKKYSRLLKLTANNRPTINSCKNK